MHTDIRFHYSAREDRLAVAVTDPGGNRITEQPSPSAAAPRADDGGSPLGELAARQAEALRLSRIGNWELDLSTGRLLWSGVRDLRDLRDRSRPVRGVL